VDLTAYLCNNSSSGVKMQGVCLRDISGGKTASYRALNIIKSSQVTSHVNLEQKSAICSVSIVRE
jgi:hypothetical protein